MADLHVQPEQPRLQRNEEAQHIPARSEAKFVALAKMLAHLADFCGGNIYTSGF